MLQFNRGSEGRMDSVDQPAAFQPPATMKLSTDALEVLPCGNGQGSVGTSRPELLLLVGIDFLLCHFTGRENRRHFLWLVRQVVQPAVFD
jgi:hypothetical protein